MSYVYLIQDQYDRCWCEEPFNTGVQANAVKKYMQDRIDPRIQLTVRSHGSGPQHIRMEFYPDDPEVIQHEPIEEDCDF